MKFFTVFAAMLFAVQAFAQDVKGYYVTYDGKRVEGYFKQGDFNDVSSLEFRRNLKADYLKMSAEAIQEYGTGDEYKFEKHLVKIDVAPNNTTEKNPQMKSETLFLSVIIKGNTSLYSYTKDYNTKFFIKTKNQAEPEQLIYRKYQQEDGSIAENAMFRQQMYTVVNCKGNSADYYANLVYYRKQLSDMVKENNTCQGSTAEEFFNESRKDSEFHYSVFAGLYSTKFGLTNAFPEMSDESTVRYGFGGEVSYVFPSGKVGLFARVEYESMNIENTDTANQGFNLLTSNYKIDGYAINVTIGPRYNIVAADNHKVFLDAGFVFSKPFGDIYKTTFVTPPNGGEQYAGEHNTFKLLTSFSINMGVGYIYHNRYGLSVRYETTRDFLDDAASSYKTKIGRVGVNLSYYFN